MHLQATLLTLLFSSIHLASAQGPNDPGFYNTVAEIYAGPDCAAESFVWNDPVFGRGGSCQLIDRNDNTPDVLSYRVVEQYPGCAATLYTDDECLGTPFPAAVGQCVSVPRGSAPFVRVFVQCPFSR